MEKCRRLPAAIAYFALPWFFPAGRNTPVQTGADRRRQTARAQSAISAPGTVQSKMVLQLMPFPRIDGLYSGVWDGSSW